MSDMANPLKLTPDQERVAFYHSVGLAMTQWAHIEFALLSVASACFDDNPLLTQAFYAIENFRSKLAFVQKTFEASTFQETHGPEFAAIAVRADTLAKYRNKIAHARVINYPFHKAGQRVAIVPIFPAIPGEEWIARPPSNAIFLTHIDAAAKRFARAANDLHHLRDAMLGKEQSAGQNPQDIPHLNADQLVAQIQTMLKPPEKVTPG